MYEEFYNLKEKPFNLTPSSKFLYLGDIHKEALALLNYGVIERMGFLLLTGEVGTGKTTMVHALLAGLGNDVQYVYLSNPLFSVNDFMDYLAFSAFNKKVHFQSKSDFLIQFEAFLKEQLQHQKNFILIIDEAQKLSIDLLEEIRLLSNMETADEKLINIFLIGQPELNETLSRPECRPLLQRISIRYHIKALDLEETSDYIVARLKTAGAENGSKIIPKKAINEIYKYSKGYPRMINILADNLLLLGYSRGEKKLTPLMVRECYTDLQLEGSFFETKDAGEDHRKTEKAQPVERKSRWRWVAVLFILLLMLIALAIGFKKEKSVLRWVKGFVPVTENRGIKAPDSTTTMKENIKKKQIIKPDNNTYTDDNKNVNETGQIQTKVRKSVESEENKLKDNRISYDKQAVGNVSEDPNLNKEETEKTLTLKSVPHAAMYKTRVVKTGETLTELATSVYGYVNDNILNLIKENNPEIKDIDYIEAGQRIRFPNPDLGNGDKVYTVNIASFRPFKDARDLFNELIGKGYEAYIIPVYDKQKEKIYKVTIGSFNDSQKANEYASSILKKGISKYADTILLEMR